MAYRNNDDAAGYGKMGVVVKRLILLLFRPFRPEGDLGDVFLGLLCVSPGYHISGFQPGWVRSEESGGGRYFVGSV